MYNQHTRGMATTRHKRLVERGGRKAFVRDKGLANTQKEKIIVIIRKSPSLDHTELDSVSKAPEKGWSLTGRTPPLSPLLRRDQNSRDYRLLMR